MTISLGPRHIHEPSGFLVVCSCIDDSWRAFLCSGGCIISISGAAQVFCEVRPGLWVGLGTLNLKPKQ